MTIDVPSNVNVITRGVKQGNPLFQEGIFDYIDTMTEIRENNIYLIGKDTELTYKITVTMTEDANSKDYINFKRLSTSEQNTIMESLANQDMVLACSMYETEYVLFYESIMKYTEENEEYFVKQYYTVVNGQNINISVVSLNGQLSDEANQTIAYIIDNVAFDINDDFFLYFSTGDIVIFVIAVVLLIAAIFVVIKFIYFNPKRVEERRLRQESGQTNLASETEGESQEAQHDDDIITNFFATDKELEEKEKLLKEEVDSQAIKEGSGELIIGSCEYDSTSQSSDTVDADNTIDIPFDKDENCPPDDDEELDPLLFEEDIFVNADNSIQEENKEERENEEEEEKKIELENEEEPVDLAAAIAYFEDDFYARKDRREKINERHRQGKKKKWLKW